MDFHAGRTGLPDGDLSLPPQLPSRERSRRSTEFERGGLPRQSQSQQGASPPQQHRRSQELPKDLTEFPRELAPVFKGYLSKQGKSQLLRRWQRRYFVLYPGFLMYWPEERDFVSRKKPKGFVDLSECSLAPVEQHTNRAHSFGIFHHERRDYFLDAPSHHVLLEWVHHIEHMLGVDEESVGMEDFELLNLVSPVSIARL
jgi:hypothetical protein